MKTLAERGKPLTLPLFVISGKFLFRGNVIPPVRSRPL